MREKETRRLHSVTIEAADVRAAEWTVRWLEKLSVALGKDSITAATCTQAVECIQEVLSTGPEFVIRGVQTATAALPMEGNPVL